MNRVNFKPKFAFVISFLSVFLFLSEGGGQSAHAAELSLMGAATYSLAQGSPQPIGLTGFPGGGGQLAFNLGSRRIAFEVGGFYLTSKFNNTVNVVEVGMISIPVGFKFRFSRAFFMDLGAYVNFYRSHPMDINQRDQGIYAGLGFKIPLNTNVAITLNPRYNYGLVEQTNDVGTFKPHQFVFLAGLTFGG